MRFTFARFDLRTLFGQTSRSTGPLLAIVALAVVFPIPGFGIALGAVVASLTVGTPFLTDQRGRLDLLYGMLPIARRDVVVGRYVTTIAFALVALVIGLVTTLGVGAVHHDVPDPATIVALLAAGVLAVALALSVQVPLFFRFGFDRARPLMYLPAVVLGGAVWVADRVGLVSDESAARVLDLPAALLLIGSAVVGAVVVTASALLAARWYSHRPL